MLLLVVTMVVLAMVVITVVHTATKTPSAIFFSSRVNFQRNPGPLLPFFSSFPANPGMFSHVEPFPAQILASLWVLRPFPARDGKDFAGSGPFGGIFGHQDGHFYTLCGHFGPNSGVFVLILELFVLILGFLVLILGFLC